jgi:transcriptional regulator with XRE-family HTH domain
VRTIHTKLHRDLVELLASKRTAAKLNQRELARRVGHFQSWVAKTESGQRRVDVVELFALADAIGFDVVKLVKRLRELHPPHGKRSRDAT